MLKLNELLISINLNTVFLSLLSFLSYDIAHLRISQLIAFILFVIYLFLRVLRLNELNLSIFFSFLPYYLYQNKTLATRKA